MPDVTSEQKVREEQYIEEKDSPKSYDISSKYSLEDKIQEDLFHTVRDTNAIYKKNNNETISSTLISLNSVYGRFIKIASNIISSFSVSDVYSSVFAPYEIKRKSHMLVQVYFHLYSDSEKIKEYAKEAQSNAKRRDFIPLQCKLKNDDKVDVILNIYGETLQISEKKSIVWKGVFTKCSFDYFVPQDIKTDELYCTVMLIVNGTPVGEMKFITKIVIEPHDLNADFLTRKFNKVFISYSHKDQMKVKFIAEGYEALNIDHFFDRHYLKAGDIFPKIIQDYINSADLFILCWSENASRSEYVKKERMQALERAKPPSAAKLTMYPINIEPFADPPSDMKDNYHFKTI